jgi:hypothetical protein
VLPAELDEEGPDGPARRRTTPLRDARWPDRSGINELVREIVRIEVIWLSNRHLGASHRRGKLCICAVKNACSRRVAGHAIETRLTQSLRPMARVRGPSRRRPPCRAKVCTVNTSRPVSLSSDPGEATYGVRDFPRELRAPLEVLRPHCRVRRRDRTPRGALMARPRRKKVPRSRDDQHWARGAGSGTVGPRPVRSVRRWSRSPTAQSGC